MADTPSSGKATALEQDEEARRRQEAGTVVGDGKGRVAVPTGKTKGKQEKEELPPLNRMFLALLSGVLLALIHYAIDAGLNYRFIAEPVWNQARERFIRSVPPFAALFYLLHPHPDTQVVVIGVPLRYQATIRRVLFFTLSVACSVYCIYTWHEIGIREGVKATPSLGTLFLWTVYEQDALPAAVSLGIAAATITHFYKPSFRK